MHEDSKIAEAEYFLRRLEAAADDPQATRYEASAFLSAARSVLQYALKEATTNGGKWWYQAAVSRDPVIGFLKEHRDINIHERPFSMRTNLNLEVEAEVVKLSSTSVLTVITGSGERELTVSEALPEVPTEEPHRQSSSRSWYQYLFKDWPGTEDVQTLCARYLTTIRNIVADGRARGFLTA